MACRRLFVKRLSRDSPKNCSNKCIAFRQLAKERFFYDEKKQILRQIKRFTILFLGAIIYAAGLEIFLLPNNVIDDGVVGVSIMARHLTGLPLGVFLIGINIPFIYLGYKQIGKTFTVSTMFAIVALSYWNNYFLSVPRFTSDLFLAAVFGGIILGIGVGLIVRYGGSLDGTEIVAILVNKASSFSVGEVVLVINLFILSAAGLVFGWDRAMYSLITYYVASKVMDIVIGGLDESKSAIIISDQYEAIAEILMARLGRGVTILSGVGGYSREEKLVLYVVVTRLEISKLKSLIDEIDESAFVAISDIHDVMGGKFKKRSIH